MTISTLDPKTALVVIDLQKGIVSRQTAHPVADVVARSATLARAFRARKLPVVLVNVAGGAPGRTEQVRNLSGMPPDWAELVPELEQAPGDHTVTKHSWGAFNRTGLEELLRTLEVTQVLVTGVATSAGVESTARQAYELGFNVALAIDAMTDMSQEAHQNSVTRIFPKLGETGTTDEILALLERHGG